MQHGARHFHGNQDVELADEAKSQEDSPNRPIWKERMLRRLKSQSKIEAECPVCHHVVCGELCQQLQQKKEVLAVWKRFVGIGLPMAIEEDSDEEEEPKSTWTEEGDANAVANQIEDGAVDDSDVRTFEKTKAGSQEDFLPLPQHYVFGNDGNGHFIEEDGSDAGSLNSARSAKTSFRARFVFERVGRSEEAMKKRKTEQAAGKRPVLLSSEGEKTDELKPWYTPADSEDTTVVFESRFECGNLYSAKQVSEFEYELQLCTDYNTNGHTQWFYFSMSNVQQGAQYRLSITNLLKPTSLYGRGLQPLLYSTVLAQRKGVGWVRAGSEIRYFANSRVVQRNDDEESHVKGPQYHRTLSFVIEAPAACDTLYVAHCYPYSYSSLQQLLSGIAQSDGTSSRNSNSNNNLNEDEPSVACSVESHAGAAVVGRALEEAFGLAEQGSVTPIAPGAQQRGLLCRTVAGNRCDVITVTSPEEGHVALKVCVKREDED